MSENKFEENFQKAIKATATTNPAGTGKIYVGLNHPNPRQVFRSPTTPTETSHGHLYKAIIGPFRTMRAAKFMASQGSGNPHLQSVADAERIVRDAAKIPKPIRCTSTFTPYQRKEVRCIKDTGHPGPHRSPDRKFPGGTKTKPWGSQHDEWY